jgi:hypothetical protein
MNDDEYPDYDLDDMLECPHCGKLFENDGGGLYCSSECEELADGGCI